MPKTPDPLAIKRKRVKPSVRKPTTSPNNGGRRAGAGRVPDPTAKKAIIPRRSMEAAARIYDGVVLIGENGGELPPDATPLDVMVEAMRIAYKLGGALAAFPYAEKAAPYLHARIANIMIQNPNAPVGQQQPRYQVEFIDAPARVEVTDVEPKVK